MPENFSDLEKQYNLLFEVAKSNVADQNLAIDSLNVKVGNLLIAQGFVFAAFVAAFNYPNFDKNEYLFLFEIVLFLCSFATAIKASSFNQKTISPSGVRDYLMENYQKGFQYFQIAITQDLIISFEGNKENLERKFELIVWSQRLLMSSLFLFLLQMAFTRFGLTDFIKICLSRTC